MSQINEKRGGRFFNIQNISEVSSKFKIIFEKLSNIAATSITLKLKRISKKYFKDVKIGKSFGRNKWKKLESEDETYELKIPHLPSNSTKVFVF